MVKDYVNIFPGPNFMSPKWRCLLKRGVPKHWHSKNGCLKKGCVHISFQRPPCSDTKCERCIRYGKTGNKKRAAGFETLLQNQLKSDVARFTTHVQTC